jgi:hypothetical protein
MNHGHIEADAKATTRGRTGRIPHMAATDDLHERILSESRGKRVCIYAHSGSHFLLMNTGKSPERFELISNQLQHDGIFSSQEWGLRVQELPPPTFAFSKG